MASASDLRAQAKMRPPCPSSRGRETQFCSVLPSLEGDGWGRDVEFRRLHPLDQIVLAGRVEEAAQALSVEGETKREFLERYGVPDLDGKNAREVFFENAWMLAMGTIEPHLEISDAIAWLSNDELDNIPVGDVAQWMLIHIRALNGEQPGMEDVGAGMATLRRLPGGLQLVERAVLQGGNALEMLLEGQVPQSQKEMAAFITRWGGIISQIVLALWTRQAKIQAEATADAISERTLELLESLGQIERVEKGEDG